MLALGGCASLSGFETDAQVRIFEGDLVVKGGNILTPVRGGSNGHGCIISIVGKPKVAIAYRGERCMVRFPE